MDKTQRVPRNDRELSKISCRERIHRISNYDPRVHYLRLWIVLMSIAVMVIARPLWFASILRWMECFQRDVNRTRLGSHNKQLNIKSSRWAGDCYFWKYSNITRWNRCCSDCSGCPDCCTVAILAKISLQSNMNTWSEEFEGDWKSKQTLYHAIAINSLYGNERLNEVVNRTRIFFLSFL